MSKAQTRSRLDLAAVARNDVLGSGGERVGHIRELIVNSADGRIEFATLVLKQDPCDKPLTVRVPWSQFDLQVNDAHLKLDMSLAVLRSVARRGSGSP